MIKLDCGAELYLDSFYFTPTYAGCILGWPDKDAHEEIIIGATELIGNHLRSHPYVHLIKPKIQEYDDRQYIPWYTCGAYLLGPELKKEAGYGSHLVIAFFSDQANLKSPEAMVLEVIHDINWEEVARGYEI